MTEPATMTNTPIEPASEPYAGVLTLTNVVNMTGEPIAPPAKPKRKYTRKAKPRVRKSKASAAIMPSPDSAPALDASQAVASVTAWSPPVPPVSMMRSIYDLLTPPGGNQGTRILRFSERFWLLLLSALSVSIGTTAAVYWW